MSSSSLLVDGRPTCRGHQQRSGATLRHRRSTPAARDRSPGHSRPRAAHRARVSPSSIPSATVFWPSPRAIEMIAWTNCWSAGFFSVVNELDVDLQILSGDVLEVGEGAEAGAKIVEREAAAELADPPCEVLRVSHVGDRGGLGDLEVEAARVGPFRNGCSRNKYRGSVSERTDRLIATQACPSPAPALVSTSSRSR